MQAAGEEETMHLTKIKLMRLQRGLLQWELAQMAGIPESNLSKIETGRMHATEETLTKIASILQANVNDLREDESGC